MNNKKRGFTLIELLVVIAIIGILSSVVLSNVLAAREKARDVKRIAEVNQIQKALELYHNSCEAYPTAQPNDELPLGSTNNAKGGGTCADSWSKFMSNNPTPPAVSTPAKYGYSSTDANYCVMVDLERDSSSNKKTECATLLTDFTGDVTDHHSVYFE